MYKSLHLNSMAEPDKLLWTVRYSSGKRAQRNRQTTEGGRESISRSSHRHPAVHSILPLLLPMTTPAAASAQQCHATRRPMVLLWERRMQSTPLALVLQSKNGHRTKLWLCGPELNAGAKTCQSVLTTSALSPTVS